MSDGLGRDSLKHHNDQHVQIRRDFFDLCEYDKNLFNNKLNGNGKIIKDEPDQECMAKILRIIETLTNTARSSWYVMILNAKAKGLRTPEESKEYPIELAYGALYKLMYQTHSESIIRNSVAALIKKNYIIRNQETNNSIPTYILNVPVLQKALDLQEEDSIKNRGVNSTANKKGPGRPRKQENWGVNSTAEGCENNSQQPENNSQRLENNTNNISNNKVLNKPNKKVDVASLSKQETNTTTTTNPSLSEQSENHEPEEKPTEPDQQLLEAMPWGAEKALQITETLSETKCKNKPKELAVCAKILENYQPTEEEYSAVVQRMLAWWNGSLYPSHLLEKNKTSLEIRFPEILREVKKLQKRNVGTKVPVIKNQQLSREELIAKALAFPVGMDHTTKEYEDLQNCMMYLQPDDRKEVTKQRLLKQVEQNKQRANAMVGA